MTIPPSIVWVADWGHLVERDMSQERHRILQMLADGKLSVDEATQLLDAAGGPVGAAAAGAQPPHTPGGG